MSVIHAGNKPDFIDIFSLTTARIQLHKPKVMQYYIVHFTAMGVVIYIGTCSAVENRTMEESYPVRQFNIAKRSVYLVKPHDSRCCTFDKI